MPDEVKELAPWVVKGVSEDTRRKVKVFAAQNDLTMGQAVETLVDRGLASGAPAISAPDPIFRVLGPSQPANNPDDPAFVDFFVRASLKEVKGSDQLSPGQIEAVVQKLQEPGHAATRQRALILFEAGMRDPKKLPTDITHDIIGNQIVTDVVGVLSEVLGDPTLAHHDS